MKKLVCLVLSLSLCILMGACGNSTTSSASAPDPSGSASVTESSAPAAPEKVYTIKLAYTPGSMAATESPDIMYAETFKKHVEENSGGAIIVELYPSGQLGSAAEAVQGVIGGTIEMSIVNINMIVSLYDDLMVLGIPGMFNSVEECDAVLASDWGKQVTEDVRAATGIRMLNMCSNGFRHFTTNNKELKVVGDAKGVTFRVMESPVSIKMVEALGAKAVPMPGSEMYVAMQNGVVDGQENPILNIIQDKTYEVQKYLVMDGHLASVMSFIISDKTYSDMAPELQTVINEGAEKALADAKKVIAVKNQEGIKILEDYGMTVYQPTDEELAAWHSAVFDPTQEYVRSVLGEAPVDALIAAVEAQRK